MAQCRVYFLGQMLTWTCMKSFLLLYSFILISKHYYIGVVHCCEGGGSLLCVGKKL